MDALNSTIRIAIAGKQNLENVALPIIKERLEIVLHALKTTILDKEIFKLQFLTGLAEGADQFVTQIAVNYPFVDKNGLKFAPDFNAVIPFSVGCYENHPLHPIINKNKFKPLLNKCRTTICVNDEVTSNRICHPDYIHLKEAADRAYEAQALLMLKRCDILIALTHPGDEIKTGGTMHTISRARAYHIPVIFISLADNNIYILNEDNNFFDSVALAIRKKRNDVVELQSLFAGIFLQQNSTSTKVSFDCRKILFNENAQNTKTDVNTIITKFQQYVDNENAVFSKQYKRNQVTNNVLTAVSIAIAIVSLYFFSSKLLDEEYMTLSLFILVTMKFSFTLFVNKNSKSGKSKNTEKKMKLTRYLAERLRIFNHLTSIGILKGIKPSLGKHLTPLFGGAASEAIYRKIEGTLSFQCNGTDYIRPYNALRKFNDFLVNGQIGYFNDASGKMRKREVILERRKNVLEITTIVLTIVDGLILLASFLFWLYEPKEKSSLLHDLVVKVHDNYTPIFIGITALFPVIIAFYNIVSYQSETIKLKDRFTIMKNRIKSRSWGLVE